MDDQKRLRNCDNNISKIPSVISYLVHLFEFCFGKWNKLMAQFISSGLWINIPENNRIAFYEYYLANIDGILCVSHNPKSSSSKSCRVWLHVNRTFVSCSPMYLSQTLELYQSIELYLGCSKCWIRVCWNKCMKERSIFSSKWQNFLHVRWGYPFILLLWEVEQKGRDSIRHSVTKSKMVVSLFTTELII